MAVVAAASAFGADLRTELATQLNARGSDFVLNFPPRAGCLPGSIFTADLRIPLERTARDDAALTRGPAFGLEADIGNMDAVGAGATFAPVFGFLFSHKSAGTTRVSIERAHMIEMLGGDLKKHLLASEAAQRSADAGVDPFIVFRAYEGFLTLSLRKNADTNADAWARVKAQAVEVQASGAVADEASVSFKLPERVVFAFEVMKATYVTTHLGGGPNDVSLRKIPADEFAR